MEPPSIVDQIAELPRQSLAKLLVDVLEQNRRLKQEIAQYRPKPIIIMGVGKSYPRGKYHVYSSQAEVGTLLIPVSMCGATLWSQNIQYEFSGTWESLRKHIAQAPEEEWCQRCRNYVFDQEVKARAY